MHSNAIRGIENREQRVTCLNEIGALDAIPNTEIGEAYGSTGTILIRDT